MLCLSAAGEARKFFLESGDKMDYSFSGGMLLLKVNAVQAVALAVMTYYFGVWVKSKLPVLAKYSIPTPVVGGMTFALLLSVLEGCGVMKVQFDGTLQTILMLAFYTTIGLMASLKLIRQGGGLLIAFLAAASVLAALQNCLGMGLAGLMGIDPHYGLLTGSISMTGGLGTAAAFGPFFEQNYSVTGATAVGITSATFGMVVALMLGGPFGEWLIHRYKVPAPKAQSTPEPQLHIPQDMETPVAANINAREPSMTEELMKAGSIVAVCVALGMVLSQWMGQYITLPAYIGAMIVAALVRNFGDFSGAFRVEGKGLTAVADISLVIFVTMAINSLKLYELIHLAIPMLVILVAQTILILIFAWLVIFTMFGRTYDTVMLSAGTIGFGMGATVNALANMQAIAEKWGPSPKAWLIVSIVGAFLIDLVNALLITTMCNFIS